MVWMEDGREEERNCERLQQAAERREGVKKRGRREGERETEWMGGRQATGKVKEGGRRRQ